MAIFGTLEVIKTQTINSRLLKAIEYLETADLPSVFSKVTQENKQTVEIEGKRIFVIFQKYNSKLLSDVKLEGHKQYIDIQYIYSGEERIFLANENDILKTDTYSPEKDIHFPEVKSFSHIQLRKGDAAILFPEDLHGPCCCVDFPAEVQKIVIKVALK
jgi:biofilm protein TabA